MKNFPLRAAIGFVVRLLIVTPFVLLLANMGEYSTINNNISVFLAVILGACTLLYLGIMTFVPAEYAIKTGVSIIEFHMWKPQIVMVLLSAVIVMAATVAMASFAFYWTAGVLFLYSLSMFMWPKYITRIDAASKDHMLSTLRT
jgi:hypothetical protein